MKYAMTLITTFLTCSTFAVAEEIPVEYLMKSSEFDTIAHNVAKDVYVAKITQLLKNLRVQQGDYKSDRDDDPERVRLLIRDRERWAAIRQMVDKICGEIDLHQKTCKKLEDARDGIAGFIKRYPEGSKELEKFKQRSAAAIRR